MKDVLIEMQQERAFLCRGAEGREGSEVALCATSSSEKLPLLNFRRRRAVEAAAEAVEAVEAAEDGRGRRTTMVARRRFFPSFNGSTVCVPEMDRHGWGSQGLGLKSIKFECSYPYILQKFVDHWVHCVYPTEPCG